jgi:hypothetical protein
MMMTEMIKTMIQAIVVSSWPEIKMYHFFLLYTKKGQLCEEKNDIKTGIASNIKWPW